MSDKNEWILSGCLLMGLILTACGEQVTPASSTATNTNLDQYNEPEIELIKSRSGEVTPIVLNAETKWGKRLYKANCISCHDAQVYQRVERKIKNREQLGNQVSRCNANLAEPLSANEVAQVAAFLNAAYYQFAE
ncbi:MAG: hypothetical protein CR991_07990 [Proteobacteria bacterium]|nr:MAG: hypothetical protein CR991_07990 [Pseudomonadota bacterium]